MAKSLVKIIQNLRILYEMIFIPLNLKLFGAKMRNFWSSVKSIFFKECTETRTFILLALNIRNEIVRLIGTGVILIWLVLQTQALQQNIFQFSFNIEQIKVNWFFYNFLILYLNLSVSLRFIFATIYLLTSMNKWKKR